MSSHDPRLWREARDAWQRLYGADSPQAAWAQADMATAELALGRPRAAIALLEKANLVLKEAQVAPSLRAPCRFHLARALRELGREPVRARALAVEARELFALTPGQYASEIVAIDAWLAAGGPP